MTKKGEKTEYVRVQYEKGGKISAGEALKGKKKRIKATASRGQIGGEEIIACQYHLCFTCVSAIICQRHKLGFGLSPFHTAGFFFFFFLQSPQVPHPPQLVYVCLIPRRQWDYDYVIHFYRRLNVEPR